MVIKKEIFFISATVALVYTGLTLIFPILPFYLDLFGGGATELGYATSAFALAIFLFSPLLGRLADSYGKTVVITYSLIGYGLTNFLFIFVNAYWQIILLRFVEGIFAGGVPPAAISIASDLSDDNNRARSIAFVTAGISSGVIIGPLIGGTMIEHLPLWSPFLLSGVLGLVSAIVSKSLLVEPETNEPIHEPSSKHHELSIIQRFIEFVPQPHTSFVFFLMIQFIISISWLMVEPGFVFYFYYDLNYTPSQFGMFVAAYGLFVFIGEVFFGGLSDRFGRKIIIFIGSLVHAAFYWYLSISTELISLIIAASIAGVALGLVGPALNALLSEVSRPDKRTYIFGISSSVAGVAQIIGPLFGGWAFDQPDIEVAQISILSGILVLLSAFIVLLLQFDRNKSHKKNKGEETIQELLVSS